MNYAEFYEKMTGRIRESRAACFLLRTAGKLLTGVMYAAYPLLLLLLLRTGKPERLLCTILVPGISFVLLSLFRRRIDRPRPYETWEIDPLIRKDTKGRSMPSRHVFSSAVISMAWLQVSAPAGTALLLVSCTAAVIRVIGGVHYPSDVAAGLVCGILAGAVLLALL